MTSPRTHWTAKPTYADLFFRLSEPALLIDPKDRRILDANDATEEALFSSRESLLASVLDDWIPQERLQDFLHQTRIIMRRYHPRSFEMRLKTGKNSDQTRLFILSLCQLQTGTEDEVIIQVVARDITEERAAQEALKAANERLEALSTTDEMTQIANFRSFKQRLAEEHQRAVRFGRSYSILFFDMDHFKNYNDTNGHPAGDQLLRDFAAILNSKIRDTDLVARYGGEEFVVLATETPTPKVLVFAERIRDAVARHPFANSAKQPLGHVSVSIGVATYPEHGGTPEAVLQAADQAVYSSKKGGRDRVTLAPCPPK